MDNDNCKRISENTRLCEDLSTLSIKDTQDCITGLIQHRNVNCTRAKMTLKNNKIQKVREDTWLLILLQEEVVRTQCGPKTTYTKISGTQLVTLTNDCRADVVNRTLQTHTSAQEINEVIPIPSTNNIDPASIKLEIKLEDLELDNTNKLLDRAEEVDDDGDVADWPTMMATPSWTTLFLYLLLLGTGVWKIWQRWKRTNNNSQQAKAPSSEDTGRSCKKISFALKEGGVSWAPATQVQQTLH